MRLLITPALLTAITCQCAGQAIQIRPHVIGRAIHEGQVTTIYLAPRFATAVRMPDPVSSVVIGDPEAFSAEHSDREPQLVFIKPITLKPAHTNLIISTVRGLQVTLLLVSRGESQDLSNADVDLLMRYRPATRFIIERSDPESNVAQTASASTRVSPATETAAISQIAKRSESDASNLSALLERQKLASLPTLYGEKPGFPSRTRDGLRAGVSEVIDAGGNVAVLYSVVNMQSHAVELMPPQVQLGGKIRRGKLIRRSVWSSSEQLPVDEYKLSHRRLGPGERADGVLVFRRPAFKQSNETLLLQISDSGAVDRPALAPIGFGISSVRNHGGTE